MKIPIGSRPSSDDYEQAKSVIPLEFTFSNLILLLSIAVNFPRSSLACWDSSIGRLARCNRLIEFASRAIFLPSTALNRSSNSSSRTSSTLALEYRDCKKYQCQFAGTVGNRHGFHSLEQRKQKLDVGYSSEINNKFIACNYLCLKERRPRHHPFATALGPARSKAKETLQHCLI